MIREIKWHNHKILGNLELNFTKPDGTPYNTIVLAGENGVGKTTILETLATFLNLETILIVTGGRRYIKRYRHLFVIQ